MPGLEYGLEYYDKEHLIKLRAPLIERLSDLAVQQARMGIRTPPEVQAEIRELARQIEQIDQQLRSLEKGAVQETFTEHRIQFFNQSAVLDRILSDAPTLAVLGAPPGCGKSYLLRKCESEFRNRGWATVFLDLAEIQPHTLCEGEFADFLIGQLQGNQPVPQLADSQQAVWYLVGYVARAKRPLMLLIDTVDQILGFDAQGQPIMMPFANWLCSDLIGKIADELRETGDTRFGCILAGRHASAILRDAEARFKEYRLLPIDFDTLGRTVEYLARQAGGRSSQKVDLLARGIYAIGCGHPGILVNLIMAVWDECGLVPGDEYFDNRHRLFSLCVNETYKSLVENLGPEIRTVYPYLSLFRCLDSQLINGVLQWCRHSKPDLPSTGLTSERVLTELIKERLLEMDFQSWMWTDSVLRRLSALDMRLNHQVDARVINGLAVRWYQERVRNPAKPSSFHRVQMAVEHLYHLAVRLADQRTEPSSARQRFRRCLRGDLKYLLPDMAALGSLESARVLDEFFQTLAKDHDIDDEVHRITRNETLAEWLRPLQERLSWDFC